MRMLPVILASMALSVTPAEGVRAALQDCNTIEAGFRSQMRWALCETPEQQVALNYLLNAISRSRVIRPAKVVVGQADGKALLRIDLAGYANQRERSTYLELVSAWERLAGDDPYFHIKTQVALAGEKDAKTITVDGGWVNLPNAVALRQATGSIGAVLRADYIISRMAAEDYYSFAGVQQKQGDFLTFQGVQRDVIEKLAADTAANLFRSNVTHKPRRVVRLPGPTGSVWITLDVDAESPDRDPIRNPVDVAGPVGKQRFNFQASEIFYARPNGMWGVALYDAKGERQASVPDKVAKDTEAQDGIVQPLISCIRCHSTHGKGGLQAFTDDQKPLLTGEAAILKSYVPEVAQRVAELYDPARLNREIERDREDYEDAVKRACNCDDLKATQCLSGTYARYVYDPVGRSTAAAECGVDSKVFVARTAVSTDPIILALRSGKPVTRKSWESSYSEAMLRVGK